MKNASCKLATLALHPVTPRHPAMLCITSIPSTASPAGIKGWSLLFPLWVCLPFLPFFAPLPAVQVQPGAAPPQHRYRIFEGGGPNLLDKLFNNRALNKVIYGAFPLRP